MLSIPQIFCDLTEYTEDTIPETFFEDFARLIGLQEYDFSIHTYDQLIYFNIEKHQFHRNLYGYLSNLFHDFWIDIRSGWSCFASAGDFASAWYLFVHLTFFNKLRLLREMRNVNVCLCKHCQSLGEAQYEHFDYDTLEFVSNVLYERYPMFIDTENFLHETTAFSLLFPTKYQGLLDSFDSDIAYDWYSEKDWASLFANCFHTNSMYFYQGRFYLLQRYYVQRHYRINNINE